MSISRFAYDIVTGTTIYVLGTYIVHLLNF